jgi:hypothetical protein
MQPTREEILKHLKKTRHGTEIKFENGRIWGLLDFKENEQNWAVLAYEDEVEYNIKGTIVWKGWVL